MTSQQAVAVAELCRTLLLTGSLSHLKNHADSIYTDSIRWAKWAKIVLASAKNHLSRVREMVREPVMKGLRGEG